MKKLITALLSIAMIFSTFMTTSFADANASEVIVKTVANDDFTIYANSSNAVPNNDFYNLKLINDDSTAAVLETKVTVETAGYYDLSSNIVFTEFTGSEHYFYYALVDVISGGTTKSYAKHDYRNKLSAIGTMENDTPGTRLDKEFNAPIYLEAGENTLRVMYRSTRRLNEINFYSLTLTPSKSFSVLFNKDSSYEGVNEDVGSSTGDYLYLDGKTPPTVIFNVTAPADGYYDLYTDVALTSYDVNVPYYFSHLSVSNGTYSETFINQSSTPSSDKLFGVDSRVVNYRHTVKAGTMILKAGENTVKFSITSKRGANNIKLYLADIQYRGDKVFSENSDGIINISTGRCDLALNNIHNYLYPSETAIALRGNNGNPGKVSYKIKTASDKYKASVLINPVELSNYNLGFKIFIDEVEKVDSRNAFAYTDYTVGTDSLLNIDIPFAVNNATTDEHVITFEFYANNSTVVTVKGITLTKYVPSFAFNSSDSVNITTTTDNWVSGTAENDSGYGLLYRGNKSYTATYRVTGAKSGTYNITFNYKISQNDAGYANIGGFIATCGDSVADCSVRTTNDDEGKTVLSGYEKGTTHSASAVITLAEGVNDIVITVPASFSKICQRLSSIELTKVTFFINSFDLSATAFADGDTVTATAVIDDASKAPADADVLILIAKYDVNGRMISAELNKWNGTDASFAAEITADSLTDEIKAFLWTDDLVPLKTVPAVKKKQQ